MSLWLNIFYYNGADSLPYKLIRYVSPLGIQSYDTTAQYFRYDAQGRCTFDSTRYDAADITTVYDVFAFTYVGSTIIEEFQEVTRINGFFSETSVNLPVYINNHVTAVVDSVGNKKRFEATLQYDNKINPFQKFNFNRRMIDAEFTCSLNFQFANLTEIDQVIDGVYIHHYKYQYKYNSRNLPASMITQSLGDYSTEENKSIFIYTDK